MRTTISLFNQLAADKRPFLFIIDYKQLHSIVLPLSEVRQSDILYDFNGFTNAEPPSDRGSQDVTIRKYPVPRKRYARAFEYIQHEQRLGNSYLTNLTFPTRVEINLSLRDLFFASRASYKLCFRDNFLVFSPETFVKIRGNKITSYPMKGTIDASLPNAEERILMDSKEMAEHVTIVDLIRNDLSLISHNVGVERFRYIDRIQTNQKELLQVSSEISGELPHDYQLKLGEILMALLPAGSVTGAPKRKTLEIIEQAEQYRRGFFTGICGYFDGISLDCGVMIRFIERTGDHYFFKSGGGITMDSIMEQEYQEMIDKVYVPVY